MARDFELMVVTMPGPPQAAIAVAGSRADAIGVLNLECVRDPLAAAPALRDLARLGRGRRGIKVDTSRPRLLSPILDATPPECTVFVLTPGPAPVLSELVARLHGRGGFALLEVTEAGHFDLAAECQPDAIIVKGNEAGGWVGDETTFILLQRARASGALPVWAHGGIGPHTAAACYAAGAAGVVLDCQLALAAESPVDEETRAAFGRLDGSETLCLGSTAPLVRVWNNHGSGVIQQLRTRAPRADAPADDVAAWRDTIAHHAATEPPPDRLWLLGQDIAFAAALARRHHTVGGIVAAMRDEVSDHVATSRRAMPLAPEGPLAREHGTRYPIAQGPMTRVSDTAEFAAAVADNGGLPFVALALMRADAIEALLARTRAALGGRPWGVGILGFVPPELRREQIDVLRRFAPPFALIAGGRPDQAQALEGDGIRTYLHVPSPALLKLFIESGARRFVFEGRECGGHVGPRSSFVLWNMMVDVLLDSLSGEELQRCHVLFAGGIHDRRSAAMVAVLSAPLVERSARVGVLMGTPYLFTEEAVRTAAIVDTFQKAALDCSRTVLLETGPGHAIRCISTAYCSAFEREKERLAATGCAPDDVRAALEEMNVGRLRLASKGVTRSASPDTGSRLVPLSREEQLLTGMYMIGQSAVLRNATCSMAALHEDVSAGSTASIAGLEVPASVRVTSKRRADSVDVAIVGMACLLPKAPDLEQYWTNILTKQDAITEVPASRWDWRRYFDPNPNAPDKVISRWGGFLDEVPFDPTRYGMPPSGLRSIEPLQLLALEATRMAIEDAGYATRPFARERTAVIFGAGGGIADLGQQYAFRSALPTYCDLLPPELLAQLPQWTEDSFPGLLLNVITGRIANRFDLGGPNYTVDAACASSLAALHFGVRELAAGSSDVVVVGGADTVQNAFAFTCFSKTHALSPRGRCRPFDASADGIAISEGIAVVVLKRLEDAELAGDRIYAVVKGVAGASDGRGKGLTAPRVEGQIRTLQRAYELADVSPATVRLVEAHGTGTVVGDEAELEALADVYAAAGSARHRCAIGSVKSMIGHTKCTAGLAGVIKAALSLYHHVLPPTIGVERPNTRLSGSPFYVNTEPRPWVAVDDHPRRAAVSAFGFGGTNFHAILEEPGARREEQSGLRRWPAELFVFAGDSSNGLAAVAERMADAIGREAKPELRNLAATLWHEVSSDRTMTGGFALAVVAGSLEQLREHLLDAARRIRSSPAETFADGRGIYFNRRPDCPPKLAAMFPGQGSQYPNMLGDLFVTFPTLTEHFARADRVLASRYDRPLSAFVFPPPWFTNAEESAAVQALTNTAVAQPALGVTELAAFELLRGLSIRPDFVAGHSYGEFVALTAAGVFDEETLIAISEARARTILTAAGADPGTMAAVSADADRVRAAIANLPDVWLSNINAPEQTMISGTSAAVTNAVQLLNAKNLRAVPVRVACAFHSPLLEGAPERMRALLAGVPIKPPQLRVFSNTLGAEYQADTDRIAEILADHVVRPVNFLAEVEALYSAGARIFVEIGPRAVLTSLIGQVLQHRPHVAVSMDGTGRPPLVQLQHLLATLFVQGIQLDLSSLYKPRQTRLLSIGSLVEDTAPQPLAATMWLVNGGRARPASEPQTTTSRVSLSLPSAAANTSAGAPLANAAEPSPANGVMAEFHALMDQFLETQRRVMLAYLQAAPEAQTQQTAPAAPEVQPMLVDTQTLPDNGHRDPDAVVADADSGIDSIARTDGIPRSRLTLTEIAAPEPDDLDGMFVITDDETGIADDLSQRLRAGGADVVLVRQRTSPGSAESFDTDLRDERAVIQLIDRLRDRFGRVRGIVHLLPLGPRDSWDVQSTDACRDRFATDVKALFHLSKAVMRDFLENSGKPGGWVFAATRGSDQDAGTARPEIGDAAIEGFIKTLASELEDVRCRAVCAISPADAERIAELVFRELRCGDGEPLVCYRHGVRLAPRPVPAPFGRVGRLEPPLDADSVVLVTGGARGITAEIAYEVARRYRPKLLLAGRSPLPDAQEAAAFAGLTTPGALKAALLSELGGGASTVDIERSYTKLVRAREIRRNLQRLTAVGSQVRYVQLDVADTPAFERFLESVYQTYGRLDGVIHGAGAIEDKLVADKTASSFASVFDTKVLSALALARRLRPNRLKFLVFFSSVAGSFGSRGQADYTAANSLLNALAQRLAVRWPCRVLSINWGPWRGTGMVTPEVERQFLSRGIRLVDVEDGRRAFVDELTFGSKEDPEIILGWTPPPAWQAPAEARLVESTL